MTARTLDFDFAKATGPMSGGAHVDGEAWIFDHHAAVTLRAAYRRQIILNGINANTQFPLGGGVSSGNPGPLYPLLMTAPSLMLYPMLTGMGTGAIFSRGKKWRLRWKNSITGDVSGLSPSAPWGLDVGMEVTPGSDVFIGQTAHFRIDTTIAPSYADTMELFTNVSGDESVWFRVDEQLIGSASYIEFTDNLTDIQLRTKLSAGLSPNPSFSQGTIPPLRKAFDDASGEVWLYGGLRMGPYRSGSVSVATGSNTVTRTDTTTCFSRERVGQGFRLLKTSGGTTIADPRVYRIVSVAGLGGLMTVTPDIQESDQMTASAYTAATYEIIDDRDLRLVYRSLAGRPTNFDLLDAFGVGFDTDDELLHIFSLRGVRYGQTRRHIYRIDIDTSAVPARFQLTQVGNEGTVGFESGCLVPGGWAYVHATLGVRFFSGAAPPQGFETIGSVEPPIALGSEDSAHGFLPRDQFKGAETDAYSALTAMSRTGFNDALLSECRVAFDPDEELVHVFYVPPDQWGLREELVFDPATGSWRGPWRRPCTATGLLRNADGTDIFVFGDDFGNLWLDARQGLDMLNGGTGAARATTSGEGYLLVDSGASLDTTAWKEQGTPAVFYSPAGGGTAPFSLLREYVVDVLDGTTAVLEHPALASGFTYTYRLGAIVWLSQTAFVDYGEPVQPKQSHGIGVRMKRGSSGASTASAKILLDGHEDPADATGEGDLAFTVNSADTDFPGYKDVRFQRNSRHFSFVFYGTAVTTDPQMTQLVAEIDVYGGA